MYEKIIYISHPFGGDPRRQQEIERIITNLNRNPKYANMLFVSPVHTFGYEYSTVSYDAGMEKCIWLLEQCDELWAYGDWDKSKGCQIEIAYCKNNNIKVVYHTGSEVGFFDD